MYTYEIIQSLGELKKKTPECKEFLNNIKNKDFHQDPDKIAFKTEYTDPKNSLRIFIIRKEDRIRAIAPFVLRKIKFHLTLGIIKLFSFQINQLFLIGNQVMFHSECNPSDIFSKIFEKLHHLNKEFDAVYIENLPVDGLLYQYLKNLKNKSSAFTPIIDKKIENNWRVIIKGTFADYVKSLGKKIRHNLKRESKILLNAIGGTNQIMRVDKPERVRSFLNDLNLVFQNCWQGKALGYHQRDSESDILYLENIARKGWLRSYIMKCDGKPVSYILGFQYAGKFYATETGFDLKWAKLSPGKMLFFLLIEDLFNNNSPEILDFGYGDGEYKRILGNNCCQAVYMYLVKKRGLFRFVVYTQEILNVIYLGFHRIFISLRIAKYIRAVVRRKIF